jgi:hypothetical protein
MQRLAKMLVGTWKVVENFAPGGTLPNAGKGTGHSVMRPGPGGFSVIEDFASSVLSLPVSMGTRFVGGIGQRSA